MFLQLFEHLAKSLFIKAPSCFTEGEIRLRGGTTSREGRVEICLGGVWGTVCDNGWGTADAHVTCRQLGFPTVGVFMCIPRLCMPSQTLPQSSSNLVTFILLGAQPFSYAYFGRGSGPIVMSYVGCNGLESHLVNCTHSQTSYCSHSEDAGVRCPGMVI